MEDDDIKKRVDAEIDAMKLQISIRESKIREHKDEILCLEDEICVLEDQIRLLNLEKE